MTVSIIHWAAVVVWVVMTVLILFDIFVFAFCPNQGKPGGRLVGGAVVALVLETPFFFGTRSVYAGFFALHRYSGRNKIDQFLHTKNANDKFLQAKIFPKQIK